MSGTPGRYTRDDGTPFNRQKSSGEITPQSFLELVERLNEFDAEALAKMMDWGNPKR